MNKKARTVKITELKARVARAEYAVDNDAVARAFIARMLAAHAALRRVDVRELLSGDAADKVHLSA